LTSLNNNTELKTHTVKLKLNIIIRWPTLLYMPFYNSVANTVVYILNAFQHPG
jgi:hypothetical protein